MMVTCSYWLSAILMKKTLIFSITDVLNHMNLCVVGTLAWQKLHILGVVLCCVEADKRLVTRSMEGQVNN